MAVLYALHAPTPGHLLTVTRYMLKHGPPRIRAYRRKRAWWALEGSHRIAAAKDIGVTPVIIAVSLDTEFDHDTTDVLPDRRVSSLLEFYDEADWWVRYVFKDLR